MHIRTWSATGVWGAWSKVALQQVQTVSVVLGDMTAGEYRAVTAPVTLTLDANTYIILVSPKGQINDYLTVEGHKIDKLKYEVKV